MSFDFLTWSDPKGSKCWGIFQSKGVPSSPTDSSITKISGRFNTRELIPLRISEYRREFLCCLQQVVLKSFISVFIPIHDLNQSSKLLLKYKWLSEEANILVTIKGILVSSICFSPVLLSLVQYWMLSIIVSSLGSQVDGLDLNQSSWIFPYTYPQVVKDELGKRLSW